MTDLAIPTLDATVRSLVASQLNRFGAGTDGWVQPASRAFLADRYQEIDQSNVPLGGFEYLPGASGGGSADFNHGEAVVSGAWVARDETTTVSLPTGATTTIYAGYDVSETNTVILGKVGAFVPDDPRIPVWELTTDGSDSITDQTDLRRTSYEIDAIASRYDSTASGTVDDAEDAQELGGEPPGGWMRADTSDEFEAVPAFGAGNSPQSAPGTGSGEVWRAGGITADTTMAVQGGFGRVAWAWNCYYDNGSNEWRYQDGGEEAMVVLLRNGQVQFLTAAAGNADDPIAFDTASVEDGSIDQADDAKRANEADDLTDVSAEKLKGLGSLTSISANSATESCSLHAENNIDILDFMPYDNSEALNLYHDGQKIISGSNPQHGSFSNPLYSGDSGYYILESGSYKDEGSIRYTVY
jgi:hypothetical protein